MALPTKLLKWICTVIWTWITANAVAASALAALITFVGLVLGPLGIVPGLALVMTGLAGLAYWYQGWHSRRDQMALVAEASKGDATSVRRLAERRLMRVTPALGAVCFWALFYAVGLTWDGILVQLAAIAALVAAKLSITWLLERWMGREQTDVDLGVREHMEALGQRGSRKEPWAALLGLLLLFVTVSSAWAHSSPTVRPSPPSPPSTTSTTSTTTTTIEPTSIVPPTTTPEAPPARPRKGQRPYTG